MSFRPIIKLKPVEAHKQRTRKWRIDSDYKDVKRRHTLYKAGKRPLVVLPGKVRSLVQ